MLVYHRGLVWARSLLWKGAKGCYYSSGGHSIRNVAIVAHVDHGKTTLVDCLLKQSNGYTGEKYGDRVMDSNVLEKERGITILSKATRISYGDVNINVVDTPGHADFGGEVERALSMVDGVVLVVDSTEGPMAQTKFVLAKALRKNFCPIVVFNKADRPSSRCDEVDSELLDLFASLGATDSQMNYSTIYASAKEGWASLEYPQRCKSEDKFSMKPLLDLIITKVPAPKVHEEKPFSMLVNSIEANPYVGRCYLGRIESGRCGIGDKIKAISPTGDLIDENRVTKIFVRKGVELVEVSEAIAGDIVTVAGVSGAIANFTICSSEVSKPLPEIPIDPPTISMNFLVNDSPLAGTEGKSLTQQGLVMRLQQEAENNIAIKVKVDKNGFQITGRGEMQMGILIETMRREGFEFAVSPPKVICKRSRDVKGEILEPIEELTIDCPSEFSGTVIEKISKRKGELVRMNEYDNKCRLVFKIPMRGLIGYTAEFKNDTHGTGLMNHVFDSYSPYKGILEVSRKGSLISMSEGLTTYYALSELESRGVMFVEPGVKVYPGMVIGEGTRSFDLEVNPCRLKAVSNVRQTVKEDFIRLAPPKLMSLEETIAYMADDEIIEVTPVSIRLRKKYLDSNVRKARAKSKRSDIEIEELDIGSDQQVE